MQINNTIKVKNIFTGEIKFFACDTSAFKFLKVNTDWIKWSA